MKLSAAVGEPLHVTATLPDGLTCHVVTETELAEAKRHPLTQKVLEEQLGRLGGTPFMLSGIETKSQAIRWHHLVSWAAFAKG